MRFLITRAMTGPRLGHRGAILLILGLFDLAYGWSLISPLDSDSLGQAALAWRQHYAPIWVWGGGWMLAGLILLASSVRVRDMAGFTAAIVVKVVWALVTLGSWAFGDVPRGWISGLIWLAFAGLVAVIASWPEPIKVRTVGDDGMIEFPLEDL